MRLLSHSQRGPICPGHQLVLAFQAAVPCAEKVYSAPSESECLLRSYLDSMSMCAGDRFVARRGIFSSVKDIEVSPRTASVSGDYWQAQFRECFGHVVIVSAAGYPHLGGAMTLIA